MPSGGSSSWYGRRMGDWATVLGTAEIGTDKPWALNDHFRIGSNTKTMTGTVILQLAQEGKLALTDPVAKYVPGVPGGNWSPRSPI